MVWTNTKYYYLFFPAGLVGACISINWLTYFLLVGSIYLSWNEKILWFLSEMFDYNVFLLNKTSCKMPKVVREICAHQMPSWDMISDIPTIKLANFICFTHAQVREKVRELLFYIWREPCLWCFYIWLLTS